MANLDKPLNHHCFFSCRAYRHSLEVVCERGSRDNYGLLNWTVAQNTPDLVYYQSYTYEVGDHYEEQHPNCFCFKVLDEIDKLCTVLDLEAFVSDENWLQLFLQQTRKHFNLILFSVTSKLLSRSKLTVLLT